MIIFLLKAIMCVCVCVCVCVSTYVNQTKVEIIKTLDLDKSLTTESGRCTKNPIRLCAVSFIKIIVQSFCRIIFIRMYKVMPVRIPQLVRSTTS